MQEGGENFCKYSAIQQKGHSHFGAMAFCCALNERIPQAETKMRCDSASLLPVPTEKGAFAPFCWYG